MKRVIAALVLSLVLAGCGPSELDKERLAFEEKKYNDEQEGKADALSKEQKEIQQKTQHWSAIRLAANQDYNYEFKYWSEPVPGKLRVRNGPIEQMQDMKNRLQRKNEECDCNFPKGITY